MFCSDLAAEIGDAVTNTSCLGPGAEAQMPAGGARPTDRGDGCPPEFLGPGAQ